MKTFLVHLERIFDYLLKESTAEGMIDLLYAKIRMATEKSIIQRDVDNFVAYFKLMLSASRLPRKLKFTPGLVRAFVDRTYTDFAEPAQEFRANQLWDYLKEKIDAGAEIEIQHLDALEADLTRERKPSMENIMEHVQIAMLLKWLQGPVRDKLSKGLQDYIVMLGTAYGQGQRQLIPTIEWQRFMVPAEDMAVLRKEYKSFESAVAESMKAVRNAYSRKYDPNKYEDQFRLIMSSLDNLVKMSERGTLNSVRSFKDKIIVCAALIYIQDEFVKKDPQLKRIIQLLLSLYYQFRDRP